MLIHLVWRCNWWQTKRILEGKKHQLHWKLKTSVMANLNLWNKLWNKWCILESVAVGLLLLIIGFKGVHVLRKVWYLVLKTFLYTFVFTEFSPGNPLKYLLYVYHGRVTQDTFKVRQLIPAAAPKTRLINIITMLLYKLIAEYLLSAYSWCIV